MLAMKKTRQHRPVDYTLGMCFLCNGVQDFAHDGTRRELLKCFDCHRNVHPQCYQLDKNSAKIVQTYDWQCNDCKSCLVCQSKNDESNIVICNRCDRGYHTFCCNPPLKYIPEDDWYCQQCSGIPSSPTSLPSPSSPLSDSNNNNNNQLRTSYSLRQSPSHSAKYIESKTMTEVIPQQKRKYIKRKSEEYRGDENKLKNEPVKLRLTVKNPSPLLSPSNSQKRKRGRPKQSNTAFFEEENDFFKTFGNKLTKAEANTVPGTPTEKDVIRFEKARSKIEKSQPHSILLTTQHQQEPTLEVPKICKISFNHHLIDTWYVAPYPEEYSQNSTLYICEFCMKYMKSSYIAGRHYKKCKVRYPPGDEIYRDGNISIFEVDGRKNKMYCQNLCLMAKMFLDHKTLYYDVEPFLFYIMTEADEKGCHFVGYFSKEKRSAMNYNISCILTMPIFQRKGYGQFLIDFSYLLSKKENKTGTPERPLSDLGLLSYRNYWKNIVFRELERHEGKSISVEELSHNTSLMIDDIVSTLQNNDMIQYDKDTKKYSLVIDWKRVRSHLEKLDMKNYLFVDAEKLTWTPFVLSRDRLAALLGQTKKTIKDVDETVDVDVE